MFVKANLLSHKVIQYTSFYEGRLVLEKHTIRLQIELPLAKMTTYGRYRYDYASRKHFT